MTRITIEKVEGDQVRITLAAGDGVPVSMDVTPERAKSIAEIVEIAAKSNKCKLSFEV